VQEAEEAAAEAEAEGDGAFRRVDERGVVEPEAAERGLELLVVGLSSGYRPQNTIGRTSL
jgi:hypothetical protein